MNFETVIGLETHIELSTKSKIFCGCTTKFGHEPNSNCCPVCIGLPGSLPRLNKKVVEYAIMMGLATNCTIAKKIKMDRKNYVYPDLSKAYQISQLEEPICVGGFVELSNGKKIRLNRIHIEEDAGKLVHERGRAFVDYNRAGVPLIEIVTEPDFSNADEVKEYLERLRLTAKYLQISDCKMQEGSMRCDVNISVREVGATKYGTRTELKNMNSISFIVKAIEFESARQIECIENKEPIIQETRRFVESDNSTESMRGKEDSQDYRYFKEPDLPYVPLSEIEKSVRENFNIELPDKKLIRYIDEYALSEKDAYLIVKYQPIAIYFEKMVEITHNPKSCATVLINQIYKHLATEEDKEEGNIPVKAEYLAEVISLIDKGEILNNFLTQIVDKMVIENKPVAELFNLADFKGADGGEVEKIIKDVILNNQKIVDDYLSGKEKAIFALVGQVMKQTKGKANAQNVQDLIIKLIKG